MCKCCERKRSEPVIFLPAGKEGIQRRARGQGESILHTTTSSLLSQELAQLIYDEFVHLCSVSKHCFDLFFFCFVLFCQGERGEIGPMGPRGHVVSDDS